jgi:hypothetical protein
LTAAAIDRRRDWPPPRLAAAALAAAALTAAALTAAAI